MVSTSEAFELAKLGNPKAAAEALKQEFERLQSPETRVELCEWIADCFERLGDYTQAGNWYELAGQLILSQRGLSVATDVARAIREYERALDCYTKGNDEELANECTVVIDSLLSSCDSA